MVHRLEELNFRQCVAFMHGDVICRVTLDLVLRIINATVMRVTLVLHVFRMHFYNCALHMSRFRIPTHMVPN